MPVIKTSDLTKSYGKARGIVGMLFLSMSMFPSFAGGQTGMDINELMQQFPEDVLKAFNIQTLNSMDY